MKDVRCIIGVHRFVPGPPIDWSSEPEGEGLILICTRCAKRYRPWNGQPDTAGSARQER
jgi:hypothetical protein